MRLQYVGDGPRDHRMLPELVRGVLGEHEVAFRPWTEIRLHTGTGYAKKLKFAALAAARDGADGVVAVVDADRDPRRIDALHAGREDARLRVAVGQADPHGEAWLVDDLEALRAHGGLAATAPAPDHRNPKAAWDALGLDAEAMTRVAGAVRLERCRRARETGLAAFLADVRTQLGEGSLRADRPGG